MNVKKMSRHGDVVCATILGCLYCLGRDREPSSPPFDEMLREGWLERVDGPKGETWRIPELGRLLAIVLANYCLSDDRHPFETQFTDEDWTRAGSLMMAVARANFLAEAAKQ